MTSTATVGLLQLHAREIDTSGKFLDRDKYNAVNMLQNQPPLNRLESRR